MSISNLRRECDAAADEIERLEARFEKAGAERDRLREALEHARRLVGVALSWDGGTAADRRERALYDVCDYIAQVQEDLRRGN